MSAARVGPVPSRRSPREALTDWRFAAGVLLAGAATFVGLDLGGVPVTSGLSEAGHSWGGVGATIGLGGGLGGPRSADAAPPISGSGSGNAALKQLIGQPSSWRQTAANGDSSGASNSSGVSGGARQTELSSTIGRSTASSPGLSLSTGVQSESAPSHPGPAIGAPSGSRSESIPAGSGGNPASSGTGGGSASGGAGGGSPSGATRGGSPSGATGRGSGSNSAGAGSSDDGGAGSTSGNGGGSRGTGGYGNGGGNDSAYSDVDTGGYSGGGSSSRGGGYGGGSYGRGGGGRGRGGRGN